MKKFQIKVQYHGYSRGIDTYEIEAENEHDAKELVWESDPIHTREHRNDQEHDIESVKEIQGG